MGWLLNQLRGLVSRDFRMREACERLSPVQQAFVRPLDDAADSFRRWMDSSGEVLGESGMHLEIMQRAAAARDKRNALVQQCASAGISGELIDYFGDLAR